MKFTKIKGVVIAAAFALLSPLTHAGYIYIQDGLTFEVEQTDSSTIQLEISGSPTDGWEDAVVLDTIGLKGLGISDYEATLVGPGIEEMSGAELNANGCNSEGGGKANAVCFEGLGETVTTVLTFKFDEDLNIGDSVHLKVRFLDQDGEKVGSLLSQDLVMVPEPGTVGLLTMGLAGLLLMRRRRS